MTPLQRAEELLEKITPGEWYRKEGGIWADSLKIIVASRVQLQEDSAFISAAPALMRELVEEIKTLKREWSFELNERIKLTQQIEELKANAKDSAIERMGEDR